MKYLFCTLLLISTSLNAYWEDHWIKAVNLCNEKCFDQAENEFDECIAELESQRNESHPNVYVDRGRLCYLKGKNEKALLDLNKALSFELSQEEKERAIVTKIMVCALLKMDEDVLRGLDSLKQFSSYPKEEITEKHIIIRNIPNCKCFRNIMSSYFIDSGVCESKNDIQILPTGIMIIERKDDSSEFSDSCSAPEILNSTFYIKKGNDEATCINYCSKGAVAGAAFCAGTFKTRRCQAACCVAVDMIKDRCNWCCGGGGFYKRCIEPFENIVCQMGNVCDPAWD